MRVGVRKVLNCLGADTAAEQRSAPRIIQLGNGLQNAIRTAITGLEFHSRKVEYAREKGRGISDKLRVRGGDSTF
jgi:hypothetical protein